MVIRKSLETIQEFVRRVKQQRLWQKKPETQKPQMEEIQKTRPPTAAERTRRFLNR